MIVLAILAALVLAVVIVFLAGPLLKGGAAMDARKAQLETVRDRLLAQLQELDTDRAAQSMDPTTAVEEQRRLEFELAQVLRELESMPAPAAAGAQAPRPIRAVAAVGVMAVPLAAAVLYGVHGRQTLDVALNPAAMSAVEQGVPPIVLQMVGRLEKHLAAQPNDAQGWAQLGRSYDVLGREDEARAALDKAYKLAPNNPNVIAEYAWLLYKRDPTNTQGLVRTLYTALYRIDPHHQDAQWFLGLASYQSHNYGAAMKYWEALAAGLPKGSSAEQGVRKAIAQARTELNKKK